MSFCRSKEIESVWNTNVFSAHSHIVFTKHSGRFYFMNLDGRIETVSSMCFNIQQNSLDEFWTLLKNKTNWFWFAERTIHWFFYFFVSELMIDLIRVEVVRTYSNEKNRRESRPVMVLFLLFKTSGSEIHSANSKQNDDRLQIQKLLIFFPISKLLAPPKWFHHGYYYQPAIICKTENDFILFGIENCLSLHMNCIFNRSLFSEKLFTSYFRDGIICVVGPE